MRIKPGLSSFLFIFLLILSSSCLGMAEQPLGKRTTENKPINTTDTQRSDRELPLQNRDFLVGTAGLFARNYPNSTEEDYRDFLTEVPLTGELLGVYVDWQAPDVLESIQFVDQYAEGVDPLVAIGFNFDLVDEGYFTRNLDSIKATIRSVLDNFDLDYLAFGVEVNRLIPEISQESFLDFVEVYLEIYNLVKEVSPETRVFTIYQLEYLKGAAYLSGRKFDPQWNTLDFFEGKLDLLGLTVYPFLEYSSVSEIPADYYDEIPERIDLPIAITEMAWLSKEVLVVGGSEAEQVSFLINLLENTRSWDLEMMLYSFLYEPRGADLFESASLKTNQGYPKEVYYYWLSLAALSRE